MMKYNYWAGPARIAPSVITKANESIIDYEDSGMSILEISHRSNEYKKIIKEWWKQRVNEEAAYRPKANGKYHGK